jgi:hypothetical protein
MLTKLAVTLGLFVAVPLAFHRPLALVGAVAWGTFGLWQLRRPLWAAARYCPWIGYVLGTICAACVVWLTHDWRAGAIVLSMALLGSTLIAWWERRKAERRRRDDRRAMADEVRSALPVSGRSRSQRDPRTD